LDRYLWSFGEFAIWHRSLTTRSGPRASRSPALAAAACFSTLRPGFEEKLAPVLTDHRIEIEPDDRSPGRMCWTWHWTKARYAQPVTVAWSIRVDGTTVEFPAIT